MSPNDLMLDPVLRWVGVGVFSAAYAAVCLAVWRREWSRQKLKTRLMQAAADSPVWLVAYASQTGQAETIATETGRFLHMAGLSAQVVELNHVTPEKLYAAERALFIVSTYGEGDAPDSGALFATQVMSSRPELPSLHFAVLALGDDSYAHYCGFGRALHAWLCESGAQAVQACVDMNRGDEIALQSWQGLITHLAGSSDAPDWMAPAFESWRLIGRRHLNMGSHGEPLYEVELAPVSATLPEWVSGDLVQLCVNDDMERPREYSIASLPSEGCVRLLVRLHRDAQGRPGLSSGWLAEADIGSRVLLRVKPHRLFRLNDNADRPLILIGNGSGLAGLRGHIKARAESGRHENWLIYGERSALHDAIWSDELGAWQATGVLRLDRAYSRDAGCPPYVQDVMRAQAETVRQWAAENAAIYVCGSRLGMAQGVESALAEIVGEELLEELKCSGRYRRDVY